MITEVRLTVRGTPAPQGSKRAFSGVRKDGTRYTGTVEQGHTRVKSWRQAVLEEACKAVQWMAAPESAGGLAMDGPFAGPVVLTVTFYLKRPQGHYGTGKNADVLKESAPRYPAKAPDLSKLVRSTEDALTDAGIWADDALVVETCSQKRYADAHGALAVPGAIIAIHQLPERN